MSEDASVLSLQAVELLLTVLEAPTPCLSGEVALDHYPEASRALVEAGLLRPHGYEEVATSTADHDDVPVSLLHSDEGGLGHFSPAVGWVAADGARVTRYRADVDALLGKIVRQLGITSRGGPLQRPPPDRARDAAWRAPRHRL
jgi:hypothetical protein